MFLILIFCAWDTKKNYMVKRRNEERWLEGGNKMKTKSWKWKQLQMILDFHFVSFLVHFFYISHPHSSLFSPFLPCISQLSLTQKWKLKTKNELIFKQSLNLYTSCQCPWKRFLRKQPITKRTLLVNSTKPNGKLI